MSDLAVANDVPCPKWASDMFDELAEAQEAVFLKVIPDSAPYWVGNMLVEVVKTMNPTIKMHNGPFDIAVVGSFVGHLNWFLNDEDGIIKRQFEKATDLLEFLDNELKRKLSKKAYARLQKEGEKYSQQIESMCAAFVCQSEHMCVLVDKCMKRVLEQPPSQQAQFFDAYSKAVMIPSLDENALVVRDKFPGTSVIYGIMILLWPLVDELPSMAALHEWLCRLFGPNQIGELSRVKGIAKRFRIKLAPRGRPKKKRR
ncbi:MAG: hypothetical protein HN341_00540 [Verrucomicrobia bacterium]|jgi:hypothetical protein|nr:hypothetical protein [Verrucomicrobiota bacterium]